MARRYSRRTFAVSGRTKLLADFWSKVERCNHGARCVKCCWLWQAALLNGYGGLKIDGKMRGAHRVAYQITYGDMLPGLYVLHHCDVKRCVNPQHLWLGTAGDNIHDAMAKGRARFITSEEMATRLTQHPEYIQHGEKAWNASLTDAQVSAIRQAYQPGQNHRIIAEQYGVSRPTITRLLLRVTWKHIQ